MALLKQITDEKGVITSYHRIERVVIFASGKAKIRMLSYVDTDKRLLEKAAVTNAKERAELQAKINDEQSKLFDLDFEKGEKSEKKINEITETIEKLTSELENIKYISPDIDMHISDAWFDFSGIDVSANLNYKQAYDMLKETECFKDSKDILEDE